MKRILPFLLWLALCIPALAQSDNLAINGKFSVTTGPFTAAGLVKNSDLVSPTATLAGQACTLGSTCGLSVINISLVSPVSLNNASYVDGPSVAQGSTGTWYTSGNATVTGTSGDFITCKLWDGTTVIDSTGIQLGTSATHSTALSGYLASPAANLRISCRNTTTNGGTIATTNGIDAKASTLSAFRIQ
jgi:hypothetical protein